MKLRGKTAGELLQDAAAQMGDLFGSAESVARQAAQTVAWTGRVAAEEATEGLKKASGHLSAAVANLDEHHEALAEKVESVSMAAGIASGVAAARAAIAAPSGLAAAGVALELTSEPLIVTAAPVIGAVATAAGVVSGGTYFYSKWRKSRGARKEEPATSSADGAHPLSTRS